MKKILFTLMTLVMVFGLGRVVVADINAVTPSTNDTNRVNSWAHVNQVSSGIGTTDLELISTRGFVSCFEYRTDGDTSQKKSDNNYNIAVTDGLYPYYCVNNSNKTLSLTANKYVEVRMVFGAESDERFDWTKFEVLFNRTAEITSPTDGETVSGLVSFNATLEDKDGNDNVQWAVRKGTCAANIGTVLGNVDGHSDIYTWDNYNFHASTDVSGWVDGSYCFIFNPTESSGDVSIRETMNFFVANPPADIGLCKKGNWENFSNPTFKNQGQCVSYIKSNEKAGKK